MSNMKSVALTILELLAFNQTGLIDCSAAHRHTLTHTSKENSG